MKRTLVRLIGSTFCWLTAAYAFLCASAFTYQEMIRPQMLGAGVFARWHAALYWPWLAVMVFELREPLRGARTPRALARAFVLAWTIVGIVIAIRPPLPSLGVDARSVLVGLIALAPLLWLAAIDHAIASDVLTRPAPPVDAARRAAIEGRWLVAAMASAGFISLLYGGLTPLFMRGQFEPDLLTLGLMTGMVWNASEHAVVFCGACLAVAVVGRAVSRARPLVQYAAIGALLTGTLVLVVQRMVCDTLGLDGWRSAVVAVSCALAIVGTWGGLRLRSRFAAGATPETPVGIFFATPSEGGRVSWRQVVRLVAIVAAAWTVAVASRALDWDFLLLRTGGLVLWFVVFDRLLGVMPRIPLSDGWLAAGCLAPLALHASAQPIERLAPIALHDPQFSVRRVLDRYLIYNPSFRLVDGALRTSVQSRQTGQPAFRRFLRQNTGLGAVNVAPVNIDFAAPLVQVPRPPNLFLFVIDSLRPDFLAPYNPAVTFTPNLAAFAADSLVFRNAFTLYGGTGLSLPSIWMGAVGVHKQYVQPFAPMNALEKLLNANKYKRVMSVDVIMEQLLRPSEPPTPLDRGIRTMDYRMCRTLEEMEAVVGRSLQDEDEVRPVFGYSLPQDLHVSNIMNASVPAGESYPGFQAPYAARVHAIDRCFGTFVDFLKRRRLYEDSVIVVTSDHGEMLGEEGRWGHAYYLFPQILQVPLLIHLPAAAARGSDPDLDAMTFLTDITPTIYAALGYRTRTGDSLMGVPLIGPDRADARVRRSSDYVAAASYSAVYAAIRRNGRRVYIIDAMKREEYAYDRTLTGAWVSIPITDGFRTVAQRLIREHVDETRRVYRLPREN